MSFLKGPRFDPQKVSDVPPVGSYNPKLVESEAFIRGGFIEKSDRFKAQLQPDLPPPPIPSTSQTPLIRPFSSSSLSSSKTPKRKSPSLAWSKPFKDDPETKIIQLQARLSESVKERAKLEKEQDTLKRETRHREAALRVQLEKAEASSRRAERHAVLEARLEELKKLHEESKTKRDTEIARLKNALADSERLNKIQAENERLLQTQLVEARSTSSSNLLSTRQESRSWQEKEEQTRAERDDAQTALEALREEREEERLWKVELVASIVILYKELGNRLKAEESWREEAERRADELEGMLEIERRATVIAQEDLGDQHRQLEVYQTLLDDAYESINNLLDDHQSLRVLLDDQAQSSASNESSSLSSTSPLPQDNDPLPLLSSISSLFHTSHIPSQFESLQSTLHITQSHVNHLSSRLASLQTVSAQTSANLVSAVTARQTAEEAQRDAERALAALKPERDGWNDELLKVQRELEVAQRKGQNGLKEERERCRALASQLGTSQSLVQALGKDLELARSALEDACAFEAAFLETQREKGLLSSLAELAETEARQLADLNSQILSHNNPSQRILYVTRIRQELFEAKQMLVSSTHEKDGLLQHIRELEDEISSIRSLGARPPTLNRIVRNSRSVMGLSESRSTSNGRSHAGREDRAETGARAGRELRLEDLS